MTRVESPAKLNLTLLVSPPRRDGYHPLDSIVQTIEWCDTLDVEGAKEGRDEVIIVDADIDPDDNLVTRGLALLRTVTPIPPLEIRLEKTIPTEAGLGGGSSNGAAVLVGAGTALDADTRSALSAQLGADVPLFLKGGTQRMTGVGDLLEPWPPLSGFAVAVVVPEFGLTTANVYRRWDRLEGPQGEVIPQAAVPPQLRDLPLRNDLLPAALALEPLLGDFMADVRSVWGVPVSMTGSGSACFGYFPTVEEAASAANAVSHLCREARGIALRDRGVAMVS